mgnify:CR=1 FL=1
MTACQKPQSEAAPIVTNNWCISGGPIYTALDDTPTATAIAVNNGKISYVATDGESLDWCDKFAGRNPRNLNLDGKALYPGLTDGHAHLLGIGLREMTFNLDQVKSIKELTSALADVVAETPKGDVIYGRGWIETHWPEKRFPSRQDLDSVAPDNPVILERSDGHAVVVNSLALKRSSITAATEAPFGGAINLDTDGQPTGMLIDNAGKLIEGLMPTLTPERKAEAYKVGAALYAKRGWTNIHSMSVNPDDTALITSLAKKGDIKIRVYNSIDLLDGRSMPKMTRKTIETDARITTRAIKLYADGALGSRGAALLAPYSDDPKNSGLMTLKKDTALPILKAALRNGTQVNTHAIGDKANQQVLDWYAQAMAEVPATERPFKEPRWRIEHSQILSLDDINRFKSLGVIPSMQPSHAIGDLHFAVDRLGKQRLKGGYAWKSLIESGTVIIGGSDAPVEVGDPRIEYYAAVERRDQSGYNNEAWYPEERVSRQNALKMFTAWPAYGAFQEDSLGTIEVGKEADFTIFETDIMTIDAKDILEANVALTIVSGNVAYEAP